MWHFSGIPSGIGTNANENIHKQLNEMLYGTRVVSLEVLLARLTTFFYQYNRNKRGGNEEAWKTKIHCSHNMPFTNYDQLDGVNGTITVESTETMSPPLATAVQLYQDNLFSVLSNIKSRSIMYDPLEILLHCSFKGFTFPLAFSDNDLEISSHFFDDLTCLWKIKVGKLTFCLQQLHKPCMLVHVMIMLNSRISTNRHLPTNNAKEMFCTELLLMRCCAHRKNIPNTIRLPASSSKILKQIRLT
jgi:hypothetical protein